VSPGHLVAAATAPDGTEAVIWRWYDAVVLGGETGPIRLWEPRTAKSLRSPAARSSSATRNSRLPVDGLPGADWWVAGPTTARAEDANVELDEVERFCTEHDLWNALV